MPVLCYNSLVTRTGIIFFFLLIFVFFLHPIDSDGDFYHHVNIGRLVWQNKSLPHRDPYTFTAAGHEFIGYAWASGVIFYLLYSHFGAVAINILVALVAVLTLLLLYLLLRSYQVSFRTNILTLLLVAPVMATRWPSRPEIFTYPLVLALLLVEQKSRQQYRLAVPFPIIALTWVQLYAASFPVGMVLLALFILKRWLADGKSLVTKSFPYYLFIIFSILLSFVNGYGSKSLFFIQFIPGMTRIHGDWANLWQGMTSAAPDFLLELQYRLLIFAIFLSLFIVAALLGIKTLLSFSFLTLLSFGLLAPFFALRQLVLGTLLSVPLLGILLASLASRSRTFLYTLTLILALVMLTISLRINAPGFGEDKDTFPPRLISFLNTHNLHGRIFNTQRLGGFLSYHLYPRNLIYADTRDELFLETRALVDLEETLPTGKSILPILNKYQIEIVIVDLSEGISYQPLFYNRNWAIVYMDNRYAVTIPAFLAAEKNLATFVAIDPYSSTRAKPLLLAQAENEYQKILAADPNSFENLLRLSLVLLAQDKFDQALDIIKQITVPSSPQGVLYLVERESLFSQAYLGKKDCTKAKDHLVSLQKAVSGKYLFRPKVTIGSSLFKWLALYQLRCAHDFPAAKVYLDFYLKTQNVSPVEEIETKKLFRELK